ncbi:F-box domain, Leucine-rich repeat domain, L domain-like protein [Artemisia annua]|uniref:F-box domain, Leucine-rich repeat domain, L domain-like protein n=1 Tax=Artemisia annua TaxID=35608 RepID=A0A2U1M1I6_ARTAN|nr:F-box domain, Leucine-rich repeat domain, L domain-like protein [Artemisia annua]
MESGTTILDCQVDRLSNLQDDLIYKILSYVDIVDSIRLSFMSSRWRFIWTSMLNLNFSSYRLLSKSSGYHEFVNNVLSARNNKIDVSSVNVHFRHLGYPDWSVNRILEYAFSHNVQQITINIGYYEIDPSRLKSKSLKHLTLIATTIDGRSDSTPWDLPALTTLHLQDSLLYNCSSILAMCQNLKNLTLEGCEVFEQEYYKEWNVDFINVDTPQLKNIIFVDNTPQREDFYTGHTRIREFSEELTISARDLTYLRIKGTNFPKLSLDGCPSLEKVDLCISSPQKTNVHRTCDVFQRLHGVKSLALSLEIVELLSTSEEVISHQPSPFFSLKCLKIYPSHGLKTLPLQDLMTCRLKSSLEIFRTQPVEEQQEAMKIKLAAEVTNYLLGSTSNATFTMSVHIQTLDIRLSRLLGWSPLEGCEVFEQEYYDAFIINDFTIINSQLRSLTLKKVEWNVDFINVDTPQLKNLIFVDNTPQREDFYTGRTRIREFSEFFTISARDLTYLRIKGTYFPKLSLDGCPSLEKVDLCISSPQKTNVHRISDVFQRLHGVKSLALSLEIVELLSTSEEVISHQPSPFPSLKSLKIYPLQVLKTWPLQDLRTCRLKSSLKIFQTQPVEEQEAMKIKLAAEVTNYLLGSTSNATFTMVSHEEARAIKITKVAYRLMAALWNNLEKREAYTDTKRANVEWKKTLADSRSEDFKRQIGPPDDTEVIFRMLQNIKLLLTNVLASKRVEMQACFSRLYAKTKAIVNKMLVDMKNQFDIQQRIFSGYLDEIALSS